MADNEVINALGCCITEQCENCCNLGSWHEQWNCMTDLMKKSLDLITSQKLQIAELQGKLTLTQHMYEAAIAGQETLQQYFLTPDKPDGIMIRYNEETGKWDKYEPYMTIECPEEKDYAFIETAIAKQIFKEPLKESLADYGCPTCGAYINFDGLNGNVEHAPKYCSECGQKLDWRKDNNEQRTD